MGDTHRQVSNQDLVTIRKLVLNEGIALEKWPQIVDSLLREGDAHETKRILQGNMAEGILRSLQMWGSYGKPLLELLTVLQDVGLCALAAQISKIVQRPTVQIKSLRSACGDQPTVKPLISYSGTETSGFPVAAHKKEDSLEESESGNGCGQPPTSNISAYYSALPPTSNISAYYSALSTLDPPDNPETEDPLKFARLAKVNSRPNEMLRNCATCAGLAYTLWLFSGVLGFTLAAVSIFFMEEWLEVTSACRKWELLTGENCTDETIFLICSGLALVGAVLQTMVLAAFRGGRKWIAVHVVILVLIFAAFVLSMWKQIYGLSATSVAEYESTAPPYLKLPGYVYSGTRASVFMICMGIDIVFLICVMGVMWKYDGKVKPCWSKF